MTEITSSVRMTDKQIEIVLARLRALLYKHRSEIAVETARNVLRDESMGKAMFAPFRARAEQIEQGFICMTVRVNRRLTPQEAMKATRRKRFLESKVMAVMPQGEGSKVEIMLFKLDLAHRGGCITLEDLEKEFHQRGLKPVDPCALAALNRANPTFADGIPNLTLWMGSDGSWCTIVFNSRDGQRRVRVRALTQERKLSDFWWFAGVRL